MNPSRGEILVAILQRGPTPVRCLDLDGDRVRIAMGRNRQAQIPRDRILFSTGLSDIPDDEIKALADRGADAAREIDLEETWVLLAEEQEAATIEYIAELHFAARPTAEQLLGLAIHLESSELGTARFTRKGGAYLARSPDEARRILLDAERRRGAAAARSRVLDHLVGGRMPGELSEPERRFIDDIRSFAILGDEFSKAKSIKAHLREPFPGTADLQRRAFELLTGAGHLNEDDPVEIERAALPVHFSREAEDEAAALATPAEESRRDLTGVPTFTVDHPGTRDRDDALSVERLGEEQYRVGIHIADAGALIPIGSALDREASGRMASLYSPDTRIPMIPASLSEGAASIDPDQPRRVLSLMATIDAGQVTDWDLFLSWIQSAAAFSYQEADTSILSGDGAFHPQLRALEAAAAQLRRLRAEEGALMMERPELSITLSRDPSGAKRACVESATGRSTSQRMVMEMMILCNRLMARFCVANSVPAAYRVQARPAEEAAEPLGRYDPVAHYQMMRGTRPAEVSTSPGRHHGLGATEYLQGTAPIRRYLDLAMHRQMKACLAGQEPPYSTEAVAALARQAEIRTGELRAIEGQRRRYWVLRFLEQRLSSGTTDYEAVALDTDRRGPALLELALFPFRVRTWLPAGSAPGDTFTLRLGEVDLWRRSAHFAPVESG